MKTRSDPDRIVERYLADLKQALTGLPASRRREIQDDVSAHIDEARARLRGGDEAAVQVLLERLGDPEEIAAEAGARAMPAPRQGPTRGCRGSCCSGESCSGSAGWSAWSCSGLGLRLLEVARQAAGHLGGARGPRPAPAAAQCSHRERHMHQLVRPRVGHRHALHHQRPGRPPLGRHCRVRRAARRAGGRRRAPRACPPAGLTLAVQCRRPGLAPPGNVRVAGWAGLRCRQAVPAKTKIGSRRAGPRQLESRSTRLSVTA